MIAGRLEKDRFAFGANWASFLERLTPGQEAESASALKSLLGEPPLTGLTFLDVGSGSGLSSLSAVSLGAAKVVSFDYDPQSVDSTARLKELRASTNGAWKVERGSALDRGYLAGLGTFDVVYSWGVLHHTGSMWEAIGLVGERVKPGGRLVLAIYNDQGALSRMWWHIKRIYVRSPLPLQWPMALGVALVLEVWRFLKGLSQGRLYWPPTYWRTYKQKRGMSAWHDVVDWIGGFPFEVAGTAAIEEFVCSRGFEVVKTIDEGRSSGCNQFVFVHRVS